MEGMACAENVDWELLQWGEAERRSKGLEGGEQWRQGTR